jgi:lysophospholipase L1-like esterase
MKTPEDGAHGRSRAGLLRRHRVLSSLLALNLGLVGVWGVRLWHLQQEVDRYRRYWSVPRGEPGGILYVALGDSTAQGIGASGPDKGYVGLIANRLRVATGRPVQVVNLSRTGAHVHDVVADQLPKLAALTPDVVTVAVGGNDIRHYDAARFRSDVDALIAGLPARAVVGDVPWFMHGGTGRNSAGAAEYVTQTAESRGLPAAGLHDSMQRRGWASMLTDFSADWFHPSNRGYRIWADAFWGAMAEAPALTALGLRPS